MVRIFFIGLILINPIVSFALEQNAGIVQGLWYAKEPVFAEEQTRVYVAIRNNTGSDLAGQVEFLANGERFGLMQVSALDGRIIEAWADWTPEYGENEVEARLSRTELRSIDGGTERISVIQAVAKDSFFVDRDTDTDGTGNREDEDDDNDGQTDQEEQAAGTDPLTPDTEKKPEHTQSAAVADSLDQPVDTPSEDKGLERYLRDSRVRSVLEDITERTREAQAIVDRYRTNLASSSPRATSSVSTTTATSSTGNALEVIRTEGTASNWWHHQIQTTGEVLRAVSLTLLAALSFFLGNAVAVQLSLLIFLLYFLYRIARHFGRRPSD